MTVITLTLSWKEQIVTVPAPLMCVHHVPGFPDQVFYRRPIGNPQTTKKGGWCIEICENGGSNSTDWSPYNFKRVGISRREENRGTVQWILTCEENSTLETGTIGEQRNWSAPPMQLITQYLGVLEGKGCDIVGTTSMFCGDGTGPIWMWTLTF